ncbi:MAG: hypothetical protein ACK56I_04160 [bacterium]
MRRSTTSARRSPASSRHAAWPAPRRRRADRRRAAAQRRAFMTARPWARSALRSSTSSSTTCSRITWPPKSPLVAVRVRKPVLGNARLS